MVEIAIASQINTPLMPVFNNKSNSHYNEVVFLKEMSATLEKVKQARTNRV